MCITFDIHIQNRTKKTNSDSESHVSLQKNTIYKQFSTLLNFRKYSPSYQSDHHINHIPNQPQNQPQKHKQNQTQNQPQNHNLQQSDLQNDQTNYHSKDLKSDQQFDNLSKQPKLKNSFKPSTSYHPFKPSSPNNPPTPSPIPHSNQSPPNLDPYVVIPLVGKSKKPFKYLVRNKTAFIKMSVEGRHFFIPLIISVYF